MRWPPALYSRLFFRFFPAWVDAVTLAVVIVMRPERRGDEALYQHEATHVRQFLADPLKFHWRYFTNAEARARYEAEAYATQTKFAGLNDSRMSVEEATRDLFRELGGKVPIEQCADLIRGFL